jgi:ribonuclease T
VAQIGGADAVPALLQHAGSQDLGDRRVLVTALGWTGSTRALPLIRQSVQDPSASVGMAALEALNRILTPIRKAVKSTGCNRAILVGHNAAFDLGFVKAAVERTGVKRNPFHSFSVFDTVSLAGLAYGQTVLARAAQAAGLGWSNSEAHTAIYDVEQTARLFCSIVNRWGELDPQRPWESAEQEERD